MQKWINSSFCIGHSALDICFSHPLPKAPSPLHVSAGWAGEGASWANSLTATTSNEK